MSQITYSSKEIKAIIARLSRKDFDTDDFSEEELLEVAGQLGFSREEILQAAKQERKKCKREVKREKEMHELLFECGAHTIAYVAVITGLVITDLNQGSGIDWAYWPALGWGIALACHWAVPLALRIDKSGRLAKKLRNSMG